MAGSEQTVASTWENAFLAWFPSQGIPISENELDLSGFHYHQFSTTFEAAGGRRAYAHGHARSRKSAAIKCAAETIERRFMFDFFENTQPFIRATRVDLGGGELIELSQEDASLPPGKSLRTSNGWAVHRTQTQALESARYEALERHLLLRSFLKYGWEGFRPIQSASLKSGESELKIHFLASRIQSGPFVAGFVAAQSSLYPGASFGYCLGRADSISSASFWEGALLEAVDKILVLKGGSAVAPSPEHSWLRWRNHEYLTKPFDFGVFAQEGVISTQENDSSLTAFSCCFDLAPRLGLEVPLFAAFVWGGGLLPLFDREKLEPEAVGYLREILERNGFNLDQLPMRHPIL